MRKYTLFVPFVALVAVGAGCNPIENAKEKAMNSIVDNAIERTVKTQTGEDVDVNIGEGAMNVTGENGAKFSMGENLKLPENFPSDVPVYGSVSIKSTTVDPSKGSAFLIMTSKDKAEDVIAWYKNEAKSKGWTQKSYMELRAGSYIASYENGKKETFAVTIAQDEEGNETSITVTRSGAKQ